MRLIFCSEINDRSQALTHRLDLLALQDGILCSAMRKHCALHYYACFLIRRASYLKIRVERVGIEDYAVKKSARPSIRLAPEEPTGVGEVSAPSTFEFAPGRATLRQGGRKPTQPCLRFAYARNPSRSRPRMTKLTKRTVDTTENRSADYVIWDEELPGFAGPAGRRRVHAHRLCVGSGFQEVGARDFPGRADTARKG